MNNEAQKTEASLMMESFTCEHLNDEAYCKFHHAVLALVATAIETHTIFYLLFFYCKYKGYAILADKFYKNIQMQNRAADDAATLWEMYHSYRMQTEISYRMLYRLIISTCQQTTFPEEKENLRKLIDGILHEITIVL